jgi:hypothetical protein
MRVNMKRDRHGWLVWVETRIAAVGTYEQACAQAQDWATRLGVVLVGDGGKEWRP